MQCCGTPFNIGDSVKWLVLQVNQDFSVDLQLTDYYYEAHSSDYEKLLMLSGNVIKILALHHQYAPSSNDKRILLPVSSITLEVTSANGWDAPIDDHQFSSYIVTLDNISIRPAEKNEVTFC